MPSFMDFINIYENTNGTEVFKNIYEFEAYIKGRHSPRSYKDKFELFSKLDFSSSPLLKNIKQTAKQGKYERLIISLKSKEIQDVLGLEDETQHFSVNFDYPRKEMILNLIPNVEKPEETQFKRFSLTDFVL